MIRHPGLLSAACSSPPENPTGTALVKRLALTAGCLPMNTGDARYMHALSSASTRTSIVAAQHPAWPVVQNPINWLNQIGQMD